MGPYKKGKFGNRGRDLFLQFHKLQHKREKERRAMLTLRCSVGLSEKELQCIFKV